MNGYNGMVVYSNPISQWFWTSGIIYNIFLFALACLVAFIIYFKLQIVIDNKFRYKKSELKILSTINIILNILLAIGLTIGFIYFT